ncbi:nuclear transport factor 2 family protein [Granulicoccus phenolivorans]|uniref:nuclear transport factor 2 family protein n=1 Tax=Granulicoccus phenolivorans TaxID=266854 RepID=UPI00042447BF|nr:nuclear transport factor 2 family protein [Granulicoccus phenolivorans]
MTNDFGNVADELDIIRATHVYALGLDRFDPQLTIRAFAEDAVWDATPVGLTRYSGREELLDFFTRDAAAVDKQFHIITNHFITFDSADTAHGTNYVYSEAEMASGATIKAIALNEDTYTRGPQGWVIQSRYITALTTPDMAGFDA